METQEYRIRQARKEAAAAQAPGRWRRAVRWIREHVFPRCVEIRGLQMLCLGDGWVEVQVQDGQHWVTVVRERVQEGQVSWRWLAAADLTRLMAEAQFPGWRKPAPRGRV
jgi:hypothetical protein